MLILKLEYIYQHFQENEKVHESDPNLATGEIDNTLYPHINNNIEYGLFEDVINSYYLDSRIKDDFPYDQNCHTRTQHVQQDQTLTPCTHAYDHITQHVDNLEDPMQQHIVYTTTTTPCNYIISVDMPNLNNSHKNKSNTIPSSGIHSKRNINTEMFLATLTSNIMILIMVMHSLSQTNIQHFYNKNYKILTGVYTIP